MVVTTLLRVNRCMFARHLDIYTHSLLCYYCISGAAINFGNFTSNGALYNISGTLIWRYDDPFTHMHCAKEILAEFLI